MNNLTWQLLSTLDLTDNSPLSLLALAGLAGVCKPVLRNAAALWVGGGKEGMACPLAGRLRFGDQ